jgi:DNA replication protein DnaC
MEREREVRRHNRVQRLLRESKLPLEKSFDVFEKDRLPSMLTAQVNALIEGSFLDRSENVLAFGNPGSGKTHLLCAIGQELILQGRRVLFSSCSLLVQQLLIAKRDLNLPRILKRLRKYDALIIDDIGYVQQNRDDIIKLIEERRRRIQREEQENFTEEEQPTRYIPSKVRREVWRRDQGKCLNCGSQRRLEYDHIIPVSKGGSNTVRNIQLLCEECNRSKSNNIE